VIVKVVLVPVPEGGALPVPLQPVQTYRVSVGPATGEVTESVMLAPESHHPLVGVGKSYGDETIK
jgi:hypothetical protein